MSLHRFEFHPYFKATSNMDEGKVRFENAVIDARPAFQRFYEQCIEAYHQRFDSELAVLDVFEALPDKQNITPEYRKAMRKHGAAAWTHSTVSERNGSALLQQSAELIESLLFELTGKTKPIGGGIITHGIIFDEALKACGNYTRHRAEWVLVDRANAALDPRQYESLRVVAQLIETKPPAGPKDSLDILLQWPEPMRMCLFSLSDLYLQPRRPYAYFEKSLIGCGHEIIDRRW